MDRSQVNTLGKKIQKLRKELGLSQDEFARKADIHFQGLIGTELPMITSLELPSGEEPHDIEENNTTPS